MNETLHTICCFMNNAVLLFPAVVPSRTPSKIASLYSFYITLSGVLSSCETLAKTPYALHLLSPKNLPVLLNAFPNRPISSSEEIVIRSENLRSQMIGNSLHLRKWFRNSNNNFSTQSILSVKL